MKKLFFVATIFGCISAQAQSFGWWANNVGWDGVTPWPRYMILSPGYQGPNSLPVPNLTNGTIDSTYSFTLSGMFHFSKGDNTQNLKITANYCVLKDHLSFDAIWVPVEWFKVSHEVKTERHVFDYFYYDNSAQGDLLLNTNLQLLNRWRKHIHLAFRLGYRFPTSSGLGAARFTDKPGYYFDLSAGKPLSYKSNWKLSGMIGFYSWERNSDHYFQDDCILFGAGIEWNHNNWKWELNSCGYWGYINNRDHPVVIRSGLEKKLKHVSIDLKLQQGVRDFKYSTIETGIKYLFHVKTQRPL
jgi:hypothetical protein